MKVVLMAGGMGTRMSEETRYCPKPLVTIGGYPILWHIMKIYSAYGFHDFIVCCGYKGQMIKKYFLNYNRQESIIEKKLKDDSIRLFCESREPWKITFVNTGLYTKTAGRLMQVQKYIGNETFMLTYGDGLADVNIKKLLEYHNKHGEIGTITVSKLEGRFGNVTIGHESHITLFKEKKRENSAWVNAGFAVFNPEIFSYLDDTEMLEEKPFDLLTRDGELVAYQHMGFWSPMDNLNDRRYLEGLWDNKIPPWKIW